MENLQIIEALDEAIRILQNRKNTLAGGSFTLWRIVDHSIDYLDKQIKELLAPAENPAPAPRPATIRFTSCQTCHKPVSNDHEAKTGECYDCRGRITTSAELLQEDAKRVGFYGAHYALYNDANNENHGTFETLDEAKGAAAYDHLSQWTIYYGGHPVAVKS